jgi:hypothetical protein
MIFARAQPKRLGAQTISGPMLAGLASAYVDAINHGAVPTISTAWQARASPAFIFAIGGAVEKPARISWQASWLLCLTGESVLLPPSAFSASCTGL